MYAFKCTSCGNLEGPDNIDPARGLPTACVICGAGVKFNPRTGIKEYEESNWIVLDAIPKAELKPILEFHKLDAKDVVGVAAPVAEEVPEAG